jgi:hypothetical protein
MPQTMRTFLVHPKRSFSGIALPATLPQAAAIRAAGGGAELGGFRSQSNQDGWLC